MTAPTAATKSGRNKLIAIIVGAILIIGIAASVYVYSSQPDLTIGLDKSALQVQRGTSQSLHVSLGTQNSGSSRISLTASGLPANVTASFSDSNPLIQSGGTATVDVTVTAGTHAYGKNSTLTITATVGGLTRQATFLLAILGSTSIYNVAGSYSGGWNVTTINVTEGDIIVLHLTSSDSVIHAFFVDYNGNGMQDSSEPISPNFSSPTTPVTFSIFVGQVGTFTYYCKYHPNMTGTLHSATP